jgi:16S rRNA (guanine(966)-N(2))-methyltransferase RsmD
VRITGGDLRGRIIRPPAGLPVRPTTDFAKTALFNILNNYFDFSQLKVLDLFAGAGSISYEFISRNAASVYAIDENINCIKFIKKTAEEMKMSNLKTIRKDVFKFLKELNEPADIIFADPPFALQESEQIPEIVFQKSLLRKDGWLIIEHQAKRILNTSVKPFQVRKYSNCAFSIFTADT